MLGIMYQAFSDTLQDWFSRLLALVFFSPQRSNLLTLRIPKRLGPRKSKTVTQLPMKRMTKMMRAIWSRDQGITVLGEMAVEVHGGVQVFVRRPIDQVDVVRQWLRSTKA